MDFLLRRCPHRPAFVLGALALAVAIAGPASAGSLADLLDRQFDALSQICSNLSDQGSDLGDEACNITGPGRTGEPAQDQALLATVDDEQPGTGTNATHASVKQTQTLRDRLYALRAGATGFQLAGPVGFPVSADPRALVEESASGSDETPRLGAFLNGQGFFGDRDPRDEAAGYDFHGGGVTAGADYRFGENLVAGVAFGWTHRASDFANGSAFDHDSYSPSVYASYFGEAFYLDGIVTYTRTRYDLERKIVYELPPAPPVNLTAKAKPDANEVAVSAGGGYEWSYEGLSVGPRVQVNYLYWDLQGFTESGAGGLSLRNRSQVLESVTTVVGGEISYAFSTGLGVITPQLRAGWVHEFLNDSRRVKALYPADPTVPIDVVTNSPDRNFGSLGASIAATLPRGWSAFLDYEVPVGLHDIELHKFTIGARIEF